MLMRPYLAAIMCTGVLASGPVQALTCLRPEIGTSFTAAHERPETFHIALGRLIRTGDNIPDGPDTGDVNNRVGYSFAARFEGRLAGRDGFEIDLSTPVTVEVACVSAWCGDDSLSEHGLYVLRVDADGRYALEAGVCPMFFFDNPTEHQLMSLFGHMAEL